MGRNSGTPGLIILVCGILGVFLAACEQLIWDNGWVSALWFNAGDLLGVQIISIVLMMLIGGVLAALSS